RSTRRYPNARRRAQSYARTRLARSPRRLPPNLLPGITGREAKGGGWVRWAIAAVFLLTVGIGAVMVTTAISTAAAVTGTLVAYREVNESLPDAGAIFADTYQTTRFLDRNGVLLQE